MGTAKITAARATHSTHISVWFQVFKMKKDFNAAKKTMVGCRSPNQVFIVPLEFRAGPRDVGGVFFFKDLTCFSMDSLIRPE